MAAGLFLLAGCATTPEPKSYEISADVDAVINRDITGQPLSVVVRLYQLKQAKEFNSLTFDLATSNRTDAELFGESLIQRSELLLVPGTTHISTQVLAPDAQYLGVVAFFRRPDAHYWRYLVDAGQIRRNGLSFQALDCYLQIKNAPVIPIPGQPLNAKPVCLGENNAVPKKTVPTINEATPEPTKSTPEKPRKTVKKRRTPSGKSSISTVQTAPVTRVEKPVAPLPAPPVSISVPSVTPAANINIAPSLSLPKWGGQ